MQQAPLILVNVLVFLGACVLIAGVVGISILLALSWRSRVPANAILHLDFRHGLTEYVPHDPLSRIIRRGVPVIRDIVDGVAAAASDFRIKGVIVSSSGTPISMAHAQEIREAIKAFRKTGKFAICFAETFGAPERKVLYRSAEYGSEGGGYYLAAACDEVWLQPSGDLGLVGVIQEFPFIRDGLNLLGITPRLAQRYEYKSAVNHLTEKGMTAAHRENYKQLVESWASQLCRDLAESRRKTPEEIRQLVDAGPFSASAALSSGLIDRMAYQDEFLAYAKRKSGGALVTLPQYLKRARRPNRKGHRIALIYAVGGIRHGKNGYDPILRELNLGAESIISALDGAARDANIKAILLRIDSRGGSYFASDAILRAIQCARKAGKPVVASLSAAGASGAYLIATGADHIVAQPGSITGSIGAMGGKFITTGFWNKLGIGWDEVHSGCNATMYSTSVDYTPKQWQVLNDWLDRIYGDFIGKVESGRGISSEMLNQIGRGRIWTAEDGLRWKLVDALGGFPEAIAITKHVARIPKGDPIELKEFPPPKTVTKAFTNFVFGRTAHSSVVSLDGLGTALNIVGILADQARFATHPDDLA